MARRAGVVISRASVSDTKPTASWWSSCGVMTRSASERPHRSSRQTNTMSISRRRAASNMFSRASRCVAPEPTSRTCMTIVHPRLAAYSRMVRFCMGRVCWSSVETPAYSPARILFVSFRRWPKTLPDFGLRGRGFGGVLRDPFHMAEYYSFRPYRIQHTLSRIQEGALPRQRLAVVPGHPFRRRLLQFLGVPLRLVQIVERVGAV